MKPDLTYYHKSSLSFKNFLYFPEKIPSSLSNPEPKKTKKIILKKILIFWDGW